MLSLSLYRRCAHLKPERKAAHTTMSVFGPVWKHGGRMLFSVRNTVILQCFDADCAKVYFKGLS